MTSRPITPNSADTTGSLPECPEVALLVANLFTRLGGQMYISNGRRQISKPEPAHFQMNGEELPQMPGAMPHERFHSNDEWRGAIKLADYLFSRLSDADADLVFQYLAPVSVPGGEAYDFRDQLAN